MYQHILDILDRRGLQVIDYEDAFAATSIGAGLTVNAVSVKTRIPMAYIAGLGNFVETAGQTSVFWDLTVDDSPLQPCPYTNFQVQLASPALVTPLLMPIFCSINRTIALRARNTGGVAYISTGRIQIYYAEVKREPERILIKESDHRTEAGKFGDIAG